jgi:flagellar protein FliS
MTYGSNSLIQKYQDQAISTMSDGERIVRLYDEIIKNLKYASMLLKKGDSVNAQKCMKKCRNILNYLTVILDEKYSLSNTLKKLYTYMAGEIVTAEATGDVSHIETILPQVVELRSAWAEAEKQVRSNSGKPKQAGK